MRYYSHLNTAASIIKAYNGDVPFHHFLRDFLRSNKKYGSSDRRNISRLCYSAFRLGKAFADWPVSDRILAGLFICSNQADNVTDALLSATGLDIKASIEDKWKVLEHWYLTGRSLIQQKDSNEVDVSTDNTLHRGSVGGESFTNQENAIEVHGNAARTSTRGIDSIFPPDYPPFSDGLDTDAFFRSFFVQPDLFIRVRPGKAAAVAEKLAANQIPFENLPPAAIRLAPGTKLETVFVPDKDVVIQDYSSQRTIELLNGVNVKNVWDACAASGGKSLLVRDKFPEIELTVTDVRSSIIANLKKRFQLAGVSRYRSFVADLSGDAPLSFSVNADLVIADLPCSGSGTWSRTPEQLAMFDPAAVNRYQQLQQKILTKLSKHLKNNSYLLFITCSVFNSENEDNVTFMEQTLGLKCVRQQLITGYEHRADTMFAALLQPTH